LSGALAPGFPAVYIPDFSPSHRLPCPTLPSGFTLFGPRISGIPSLAHFHHSHRLLSASARTSPAPEHSPHRCEWLHRTRAHLIRPRARPDPDQAIQLLKGESTHWLNQQGLIKPGPFRWQSEYWAGSVSPSGLARVRSYIAGQEMHHQTISFAEECEQLFKGLGIVPGAAVPEPTKG
jgi:Transposase IS200 like